MTCIIAIATILLPLNFGVYGYLLYTPSLRADLSLALETSIKLMVTIAITLILAVAIVSESVLLSNGALGSIKLTLEKYHCHTKFCQHKIATYNQTSYSIPE